MPKLGCFLLRFYYPFGILKAKTGMDSGKGSAILLGINCISMILKPKIPVLETSRIRDFEFQN